MTRKAAPDPLLSTPTHGEDTPRTLTPENPSKHKLGKGRQWSRGHSRHGNCRPIDGAPGSKVNLSTSETPFQHVASILDMPPSAAPGNCGPTTPPPMDATTLPQMRIGGP